MADYQLIDEPSPGALARFTVNPVWPLLSFMLGGAVFSWLWYAFNSMALGSASRKKEIAVVLSGFLFLSIFSGGIVILDGKGINLSPMITYIQLARIIVCLTITYILYKLQHQSFEIYQYFEGKIMSGAPGIILAIMMGQRLQVLFFNTVTGVLN